VDIRTKLIFALVAVSLGSMFVLGAVVSPRVEGYIRDGTLRQLDQLAGAREESLELILQGWGEGTDLIASRTQLRASLAEHARTGSAAAAMRAGAILEDARAASDRIVFLGAYDPNGALVASAVRGGSQPVLPEAPPPDASADARYLDVTLVAAGPPRVSFAASMTQDGSTVGRLLAVFDAPELVALSRNSTGLGETGETLIVWRDPRGRVRTLHPTSQGGADGGELELVSAGRALADLALDGSSSGPVVGITDYRGEEVWAATRSVEETGWGLIVTLDRAEAMEPVADFNRWLRQTALILAAFAIVLGLVLALRFALPIHALAEVASRIGKGEMDARAEVVDEDEVGLLARTFNDMADELEQRMEQLHVYRKFFDVTIDLMCLAGTDGYFKQVNPAFERELGWSAEELRQRPFYAFIHPDDIEATEREVAKLAEGIPTISFENRFVCRDGSYKLLRWTSYPEGGVLYAIAHVLDQAHPA